MVIWIITHVILMHLAQFGKEVIQESPANAKGTPDSGACMKAHCEQM